MGDDIVDYSRVVYRVGLNAGGGRRGYEETEKGVQKCNLRLEQSNRTTPVPPERRPSSKQ